MFKAFAWGYWGWGGSTPELVEAFDAAEKHRGCQPPLFVDARVRREVRAVGFRGDAFGKQFGPTRYRWMQGLGNEGIVDHLGMRLHDENEVGDLLNLIVEIHESKRRVIFFCSCPSMGSGAALQVERPAHRHELDRPWVATDFATEERLRKDILMFREDSEHEPRYSLKSPHAEEAPWQDLP